MTADVPISIARLSGLRVLVLNWRDVDHPRAGGAEQYVHEITRRWTAAGVAVEWLTGRGPGQDAAGEIDGMPVTRVGGPLSLYPRAAVRLLRARGRFDAVLDCQNGIPFFSPLFLGADVPVVQIVHHVHQDQFATHFPAPLAALGRLLEGPVAKRVYGSRAVAAVSPSTRQELRTRLRLRSPIFVVPNGTVELPVLMGPRDPDPTVTVVSRLVAHKRIDFLLGQVANVAQQIPRLRVEIVGDGPERPRLQGLVADLGLQDTVSLHGRLSDARRDEILRRAWLTTSTSAAEGWGCTVVEAAAWGLPCLALRVPGVCDSVIDGRTGWLVEPQRFGSALITALTRLADEDRARRVGEACRQWAANFSWDRSARLLAGVLTHEIRQASRGRAARDARYGRSDLSTVAHFTPPPNSDLENGLRSTDEVVRIDRDVAVLLNGCDEFDAATVLHRFGVFDASLRLANRRDLLTGPGAVRVDDRTADLALTGSPAQGRRP